MLVAEAEGEIGGSSRLSGGLMMGAGTRYQKALGIEDDADALFHDYMQLNRWNLDTGVVRRFCQLAGPTVEWLGDLGIEFYDTLVFGGEERVPRVHVPIGRGQAVIDVLTRHCREAEIDVALGQRVDRLITSDDVVVGVAVGDDEITAGAVVIATGGFGNSPEKLAQHFPSAAATGVGVVHRRRGLPRRRVRPRRAGRRPDHRPRPRPALAPCRLRPDLRGVPAGLDRARQPRRPALRRRDRAVRHPRLT